MPIRFRCSHCSQLHSIATRMAGRDVKCPICAKQMTVPWHDEVEVKPGIASADAAPATSAGHSETGGSEGAATPQPAFSHDDDDEETFSLRKPQTDFEDMDLTPMVDVTFLLLIFFMITASFSLQKTLQVPPPDPDQQGAQQSMRTLDDYETDSVIVEIDERNMIVVDDEPLADPAALTETLREKIRSELKAELVVAADAAARHETVVAVIDAAQEVGMQKIRLATTGASSSD